MKVCAAVLREHTDPREDNRPLPVWLMMVFGIVTCLSGMYFGIYHGGFSGSVFNEADSTPELLSSRTRVVGKVQGEAILVSLAEQGKAVYANCVPCHQASGVGLPGQFPTLAGSDWVLGSEKRLVAILLKGLSGPLKVGEAAFNGAMPGWEKALSDKKIAAVASYIRANWGNAGPEISEAKVNAVRKELSSRELPWSEADLLKIPADAKIEAGDPVPASAVSSVVPSVQSDLDAGKAQYAALCAACHQPTGLGLPPVFPPLVASEYLTGNAERLIAIVLKGVLGPITVNGQPFNNVMPAQEAVLTDSKIAQTLTFVRSQFGAGAAAVSVDVVGSVRKKLLSRATPWSEAELKTLSSGLSSDGK